MANLKEIRTRITSVTSTRQITNAMKMVSAAKLKKAQKAIDQIRPYAEKLIEILISISQSVQLEDNQYAEERDVEKVLIIVISSNKGLCGGFNSNVIKKAIDLAENKYKEYLDEENVDFITIGKKAYDYLKMKKYRIIGEENDLWDNLTFDNVIPVAERLMKRFINQDYDMIELVYNQFKNAASQILTVEQFLPVKKNNVQEVEKEKIKKEMEYDFIYEPDKEYILRSVIPKSLKIQFYRALLDSYAAEHGARMTAMYQATDNASEMIRELTLQYNKARQASITKEILEVVSGAEALRNE